MARMHEQPRYRTPGLREFRKLSGKTQKEVAGEAEVSAGFIAALEAERMEARPVHLEAIAAAVYVEPEDLLRKVAE